MVKAVKITRPEDDWQREAERSWWRMGWDEDSLTKRTLVDSVQTLAEYWSPKVYRLPNFQNGQSVDENSAWPGDDWWEQFPPGSGKRYSPFHIPLSSEDGSVKSWKHPEYDGDTEIAQRKLQKLQQLIHFRALSNRVDECTTLDGCVLPFDLQIPMQQVNESGPVRLSHLICTGAITVSDAKFRAAVRICDSHAGKGILVKGVEELVSCYVKNCTAPSIEITKFQRAEEIEVADCRMTDLSISELNRNDAKPIFVDVLRSKFVDGHISLNKRAHLRVCSCQARESLTIHGIAERSIGKVDKTTIGTLFSFDWQGASIEAHRSVSLLSTRIGRTDKRTSVFENCRFAGELSFTSPAEVSDIGFYGCEIDEPPYFSNENTPRILRFESTKLRASPLASLGSLSLLFLALSPPQFRGKILMLFRKKLGLLKQRLLGERGWSVIAEENERRFRILREHFENEGNSSEAVDMGALEHKARCLRGGTAWSEKVLSFLYGLTAEHGTKVRLLAFWMLIGVPVGMTLWYANLLGIQPVQVELTVFIYQQTLNPFTGFDADRIADIATLTREQSLWLGVAFSVHRFINIVLLFLLGLYIRRRFQIS